MAKSKKPYLYEVDLMRIIFIFGVLLNHTTTAFEGRIANSTGSQLFLEATHLSLHFTRMGFMFMTGLVLVLNHYNRNGRWGQFWRKRYGSVGIPYLGWNAILLAGTLAVTTGFSWQKFTPQYWDAIIHGNQFYMYYILVTFELYLLFPLIVWLFKKFPEGHGQIMLVSITAQMLLLIAIKYGLPNVDRSHWWYLFRAYGMNVLVYQVYFLAGAFTAIHYKAVDAFIHKHARFIGWFTGVLALGTVGLFFFDQKVLHLSMGATESVHQPYLLVYDLMMITFVFWVGRGYAYWREHGMWSWLDRLIHAGAKVSFGIYLDQTLALALLRVILAHIQLPSWGFVLILPLGYLFVIGTAFAIAWGCYKIPPFGALIGRPQWHPFKKGVRQHDQIIRKAQSTTR